MWSRRSQRKGHGCGLGSLSARYIGPNRGTPGRSVVSAVSAQGSSGPTGAGLEESDSAAQPESLRPEEPNSPAQSESLKSEEPDIAEQSETLRSKEAPVIPPRKTARRTLDPAGMRSSREWQTQLVGRGMQAGRRLPG